MTTAPTIDPETGELFDPGPYEVPFDQVDGHDVDELQLRIGGSLKLNRNDLDHVQLIERMRLGQTVKLTVYANVTSKGQSYKTDTDGAETVTHTVGLTLDLVTTDE